VSDVGKALGTILLTPGSYGDKTISLNGPLTNCEMAAQAFTAAFGKPIIYEQVSYPSYNQVIQLVHIITNKHVESRLCCLYTVVTHPHYHQLLQYALVYSIKNYLWNSKYQFIYLWTDAS
jgi:hypothetical protein